MLGSFRYRSMASTVGFYLRRKHRSVERNHRLAEGRGQVSGPLSVEIISRLRRMQALAVPMSNGCRIETAAVARPGR